MRIYHRCDTIVFGKVLGHEKAFLIQNICPVISKHIQNQYVDSRTKIPVKISGALEKEIITKVKRVLALQKKGLHLIFPNVFEIEENLIQMCHSKSHQIHSDILTISSKNQRNNNN